ncbi:MAG: DMT family transporter [Candidatus Eisenbacteria bacterium]
MSQNSRRGEATLGRYLVVAATVFWGTTATLARFVFRNHHVPVLTVVELRLSIAALVLFPYLLLRRPSTLRVNRRDIGYFLALGLFGVAAVQGSYYYSISKLGVGVAILIQYLAPSLIVLFDFARGRKVNVTTIAAVSCALAGTALLVGGVSVDFARASLLDWCISFASAFIFAFYILYSKRGLERYPPETLLFYTFAVAALAWACVTPPWKILSAGYAAEVWWIFLALGVFSTLVPFGLFYAGLRRLQASEASILATTEPLVAVVAAALFLNERLAPWQMVGAGLVLTSAVLASRQGNPASGGIVGPA